PLKPNPPLMTDTTFRPNRLGLFTLAQGTGYPLVRLPMYAEIAGVTIDVRLPPGEDDTRFDDVIQLAIKLRTQTRPVLPATRAKSAFWRRCASLYPVWLRKNRATSLMGTAPIPGR